MDKSAITMTADDDWWLERITIDGEQRYPELIRVGSLENPRVYVPERTCHVATKERRFSQTQTLVTKSCSACGYAFGDEERRPILPGLDETMALDPVHVPSYCPHCGARVVEASE